MASSIVSMVAHTVSSETTFASATYVAAEPTPTHVKHSTDITHSSTSISMRVLTIGGLMLLFIGLCCLAAMIIRFSRATPRQTAVEYSMDREKTRVLEQRTINKSFPIRIYPSQQRLFLDKNDTLVPAATTDNGGTTDQALEKINDSPNEDGKQSEHQPANQNNALMNLARIGRLWSRDSSRCSSSVSTPCANQAARMTTLTTVMMQTTPALSSDSTIITMQPDVQESLGSNTTQELCSICLAEYATEDRIRVLPCGHEYHVECIDIWLTNKSTQCPLCKHDLLNDIPSSSAVL